MLSVAASGCRWGPWTHRIGSCAHFLLPVLRALNGHEEKSFDFSTDFVTEAGRSCHLDQMKKLSPVDSSWPGWGGPAWRGVPARLACTVGGATRESLPAQSLPPQAALA